MKSQFIIIAILISIKIIGIASSLKAEDFSSCYSANQIKYIFEEEYFYNPVFRCGNTKHIKQI